MTPEQTRQAAQVMLDSLKPGAVVESRVRHSGEWASGRTPIWDWQLFDYRIAEPKHTKISDLPPVCWVRQCANRFANLIVGMDGYDHTIRVNNEWISIAALTGTHEYSADRVNWTPFV